MTVDMEKAQPTMDRATPKPVGLGCIRKRAEQALGSGSVSSVPAWSLLGLCLQFLLGFLSGGLHMGAVRRNEPFPPQAAMVFITALESNLEHRELT